MEITKNFSLMVSFTHVSQVLNGDITSWMSLVVYFSAPMVTCIWCMANRRLKFSVQEFNTCYFSTEITLNWVMKLRSSTPINLCLDFQHDMKSKMHFISCCVHRIHHFPKGIAQKMISLSSNPLYGAAMSAEL